MAVVLRGRAEGGEPVVWVDRRRRLWLLAFVVPALPPVAVALVGLTGLGVFWLWGVIFTFVLVPLADLLVGDDRSNPPEEVAGALQRDPWYRWIVLAYLPVQYAVWAWSVWYVTTHDLSLAAQLGFAATVGIVVGVGINAAHELGHKHERLEHHAAKLALAPTWYGHFFVEHNWGHHKKVATPEDPASSRLGESFYRFWPRTVLGSLRSAWGIERDRLRRRGKHPVTPANRVLHAWALSLLLWAGTLALAGPGVLPFLVVQAVVGLTLLEAVNYVEHYGLLRERGPSGRYERVRPRHSWNNDHVVTNLLLYQLQRHSDHHENPARRFAALRHMEEAPQLPAGYASMILLALVPPLWRRVMDPRVVLGHYGGRIELANRGPRG
ncbi:MAG: Alkane-1 monooxygenase [uncultured Corynebacteriales bacterium]|uniref:Alkane-1 monooxygenase n=1 Tax=uncultured Mycobacteriales bacterium TaxID=581187 RepID=A0A6J4I5S0_9ACTN|nr:MAG: Alkane-1 monooxygenase [uncultured Corynebacteriales bacterium]